MSDKTDLEGRFELVIVDKIDPVKKRGTVKSLETGSVYPCTFTASPFGGHMPAARSLVAVYRKRGWFCQYLFTVSEIADPALSSLADRIKDGETPLGDVPSADSGETFIGRAGRAVFDNQGNAQLISRSGAQSVTASETNKKVAVNSYNFELNTAGKGISIATASSVPTTFGDSIKISKNVPLPLLPDQLLTVPQAITNISYFEIDALGAVVISAQAAVATLSLSGPKFPLGPDVAGYVKLANLTGSLALDPSGSVILKNPFCSFTLQSGGDIDLLASTGSIAITSVGKSVDISGSLGISLTAPQVDIKALTTTVSGILEVGGLITGAMGIPPSFFGVPVIIPLISQSTIAVIPVFVNGILAGNIPVIS